MSMNKVLIIGNLGSDPEMRYMPSGDPVTSFSGGHKLAIQNKGWGAEGGDRVVSG